MTDQTRKRLPRNVWVAGLVSLFTDISSEMLVPVLPLFLANVLGAPIGVIGLIEGAAETVANLMKAVSGWLSDRMGRRKPLMALGYSLSNVLKPLLGLASSWSHVLVIRVADRFGKGVRGAPRDALIADSTGPAERGRAFGLHRALDTTGAAVGPLLTWLILSAWPEQYRIVFWWAAVPGVIAVLLILAFIRETAPGAARAGTSRTGVSAAGPVLRNWSLSLGAVPPPLRRFVLISVLFALGNSADAFLILRAQNLDVPAVLIPLAYFAFNLSYSLLAYPAGALSDRIGRKPVLVVGFAVFALTYTGFALATAAWMAWPLFVLYGLYYAGTEGVQKAYVADHATPAQRGLVLGVYNALTGLAALPASLLAGMLWDRLGAAAPFFVSGGVAAVAAVLLVVWVPGRAGGAAAE